MLSKDPGWRERFYTPTSSDAAVVNYHAWLEQHGGGVIWALEGAEMSVRGRRELLERLNSHTEHCESCSQTLAWARDVQPKAAAVLLLGCPGHLFDDRFWMFFQGFSRFSGRF